MTDFRLLGPFEVVEDGRPVELPRGKPRALLARLLLDPGRVVAVETLIESIWGDPPPPSAPKVLQVYVSQLRKALGPDRIVTRSPGYLLRAEGDEHDLGRFETLAEAARATEDPARRAQLLADALALWRGPGLAEFRREPFSRPAARRLAELRLGALERRIEAELELGRHERLVAELEALVEAEPLREQLRRQLMLALYRSGRQAEALASYRAGRRLLVEELGIEPSPELQDLERAILRHDAALAEPQARRARARGSVIFLGADLHELVAPLAGGKEEWAALELGAWLARAHGVPLRLLGADASEGRRDASRMLASASLALQRFAGTAAEPVLVAPGAEGILGAGGAVVVASLPAGALDRTRRTLVERTKVPLLLVRTGLRPGGLAPDRTLTRFTWSLLDDAI